MLLFNPLKRPDPGRLDLIYFPVGVLALGEGEEKGSNEEKLASRMTYPLGQLSNS